MSNPLLSHLIETLALRTNQVRVLADRPNRLVARLVMPEGLRVAKIDTRADAFADEAEAMAILAQVGAPVSEVVMVRPGPPSMLVATWAEGEPITSTSHPDTLAAVGDVLRRVHSLPATGPWSSHPSIERWIEAWLGIVVPWWKQAGPASPDELHALHDWFNAIKPFLDDRYGTQMLFDGRPDHFLVDATGNLHLIDVADLQPGDPVMDLAVLELDAPGILPAVLAGYVPSPTDRERIGSLVPFYVTLRALSGAEWHASIDGDRDVVERNLAIARRGITAWIQGHEISQTR